MSVAAEINSNNVTDEKKGFESIYESKINLDIDEKFKKDLLSIQINSDYDIIYDTANGSVVSSIEFKKIDKRKIIDWEKTLYKIKSILKELNLPKTVIDAACIILNKDYERITKFIKTLQRNNDEKETANNKKQKRQTVKIFKYYSEKEQMLYESIILAGKPCFVYYENQVLNIIESIEEESRILIPFGLDDGPSKPYEFESKDNLNEFIDKIKNVSITDLYTKTKRLVKKYIDQKPHVINIITIDILFSYFQDRFPTTHYLFFIGDNGVGKSVIGELFELIAYRAVKMTDPSTANIYRLLGKVQPAQCTLIMDEVEKIDGNQEMMNILKTGYTLGAKVPKINTATYEQELFNAYSLKIFLSERLPNNYIAKGVLDRTFSITCLIGNPKFNLKDVLVTQGKNGNQFVKELIEEINDLRKSLFIYRLLHAYDEKPDIDMGIKGRDKELCEGLAIFFDSDIHKIVEETFQYFINSKYEQKRNTFESFLLSLIIEKLEQQRNNSISVKDLWWSIQHATNCVSVKTDHMLLSEFGINLYYNQLTTKCKVFGAESKHTNSGNILYFKDLEKLKQQYDQYQVTPRIKCSMVKHSKSEGSEGSEGSEESSMSLIDDRKNELKPIELLNK